MRLLEKLTLSLLNAPSSKIFEYCVYIANLVVNGFILSKSYEIWNYFDSQIPVANFFVKMKVFLKHSQTAYIFLCLFVVYGP